MPPARAAIAGGARILLLAAWLAALTTVVRLAPLGPGEQLLARLARDAPWQWVSLALWAGLLTWRLRGDDPIARRLRHDWRVVGVTVSLLASAAAASFVSRAAVHLTHPLLGVILGWLIVPAVAAARARFHAALGEPRWQAALAAGCVGGLVFVQSYRRHAWFGAGGKDLGLFHQTEWLLAQGLSPDNTILGMHAFADHLDLIHLAAAPLQWLWPSAGALLLFQAGCVALGAAGLWLWSAARLGGAAGAWVAVAAYASGIDLQNAVMFDFNPTTCAAGFLPWMVWAFDRARPGWLVGAALVICACKENLALSAAALAVTLALRGGSLRRWAWGIGAAALSWTLAAIGLVIPAFGPEGFRHFRFAELGGSPAQALAAVLGQPLRAFALLFTPERKLDGLLSPFSSVAFLELLRPVWLIALAPSVLERFWSSHANRWWGFHYGAPAGVVALLAAIDVAAELGVAASLARRWTLGAIVASTLLVAALGWGDPPPLWVRRHAWYATPADREDAAAIVASVPPLASVAAQNHLLPHLSGRREIFEISRPIRADVVALDLAQSAWPFGRDYPRELAVELRASGYGVVACRGAAVLLGRGAPSVDCPALAASAK